MIISHPQAGTSVPINGTSNKCCVKGNGATQNGTAAVAVYAKIYQPPAGPTNPTSGPPTDAHCESVGTDGKFSFGLIGDAAHDSSGTTDNVVYVWADFGTGASPRYTAESNTFDGTTTTSTPSC